MHKTTRSFLIEIGIAMVVALVLVLALAVMATNSETLGLFAMRVAEIQDRILN